MMKKEIWVAGYPSFYGGADTEVLHNIDLWVQNEVEVNLVPIGGCDPRITAYMDKLGVRTHKYSPKIFKDKIVTSFCNGKFLEALPQIMEEGKPAKVVWFNSMTFVFPNEVTAHQNGWITHHGFVSGYQKGWLKPKLEEVGSVNELAGYKPYFNPNNVSQNVEFRYREPKEWFALGRISRDDQAKFSDDTWNIFYKVCSPIHKKIFILGFGPNAKQRCGPAPAGLDWQTWGPNEIPVRQMYGIIHCIIHKTGGSRESYCRIVPEAYAYGVPIITEDDYAFPELVIDGVTGYRCKTSDEMSFRASELAFNEEKRKKMIYEARRFLEEEIANPQKCWEAWERLFNE